VQERICTIRAAVVFLYANLFPSGRGLKKSILAEGSFVPNIKAEPKESDDRPGGFRRVRSVERKVPAGGYRSEEMKFDRLSFQKTY
jgi:hypothetical protein